MSMSTRTGQKHNVWKQDDMDAAIAAVKNNQMSLNGASKAFSVPKSTLHDRVSRKVPAHAKTWKAYITQQCR